MLCGTHHMHKLRMHTLSACGLTARMLVHHLRRELRRKLLGRAGVRQVGKEVDIDYDPLSTLPGEQKVKNFISFVHCHKMIIQIQNAILYARNKLRRQSAACGPTS